MKKFNLSLYNWAFEGLAAFVLLVGFVYILWDHQIAKNPDIAQQVVVPIVGFALVIFTLVRIKPIVTARKERDYLYLHFFELFVDLAIGITLIVNREFGSENFWMLGFVFYLRGIVHFWTVSKKYELHDFVSFISHILLLSFGFYFMLQKSDKILDMLIMFILFLTISLSGYFTYRFTKGYNQFRLHKENQMKIEKYKNKDTVMEDPLSKDDIINPKVYEEPERDQDVIH